MSVGFGFSVGDFIAVGSLALQIKNALDDSRGSTAEYQALCGTLLSLNRAIHAASFIFFYPPSKASSSLDTSCLNGIGHELDSCKKLMEDFLVASKQYTESLLTVRQGRKFKDEWRKITWSLYGSEDVQKLQANLQGHLEAFQLYTSAIIWQSLTRTEQKTIEGSDTSHRVELKVTEMFTLLQTLNDNLPKTIGYPWEGTKDQKPIYFEDALGRTTILPVLLCSSKDSFHDVLKIMFQDLPGRNRIDQGEYEITDDSEGALIQDSDWESKVLPGVRIVMSIVMQAFPAAASGAATHECPRCRRSNARTEREKGSLKCRFCHLIFRTLDMERIVELPDAEPLSEHGQVAQTDRTAERNTQRQTKEPKEEDAFRRIHYRREVLSYQNGNSGSRKDLNLRTVSPQPRTVLVMPDRIMWEYRDPSGFVQGPFSGLEMHDWYMSGLFIKDLPIKRVWDHDFEPLAQLVHRTRYTREPFLVPLQAPLWFT